MHFCKVRWACLSINQTYSLVCHLISIYLFVHLRYAVGIFVYTCSLFSARTGWMDFVTCMFFFACYALTGACWNLSLLIFRRHNFLCVWPFGRFTPCKNYFPTFRWIDSCETFHSTSIFALLAHCVHSDGQLSTAYTSRIFDGSMKFTICYQLDWTSLAYLYYLLFNIFKKNIVFIYRRCFM